jgi:hypothetical protein
MSARLLLALRTPVSSVLSPAVAPINALASTIARSNRTRRQPLRSVRASRDRATQALSPMVRA